MTIQKRNSELADLLRPDLLHRRESFFALASAHSAYMMTPKLRGFWPMAESDFNLGANDATGFSQHLTLGTGYVEYKAQGLLPYVDLTNGWLQYNLAAPPALSSATIYDTVTCGCWLRITTIPAGQAGVMGVWSTADGEYILRMTNNVPSFAVMEFGATVTHEIGGNALEAGRWYYIAGRFNKADGRLSIWIDDQEFFRTDGPTAGLHSATNQKFAIGAWNGDNYRLDGDVALPFVSAEALSTLTISALHQVSKPFFFPS